MNIAELDLMHDALLHLANKTSNQDVADLALMVLRLNEHVQAHVNTGREKAH